MTLVEFAAIGQFIVLGGLIPIGKLLYTIRCNDLKHVDAGLTKIDTRLTNIDERLSRLEGRIEAQ